MGGPPSFRRFPERCRQGVEDPYRREYAQAVVGVLTRHWLDLSSRRGRASIFQEAPEGCYQGVNDPYRLRACSDSRPGFNPSLAGPEQSSWASLHLSGGFRGCRQDVEDLYRLWACSGIRWDFNPSLAGPKQPAWANLHLSGGSPKGAVKV